ncbi:MFS transporter [Kribbella sp. NPDC056861]|uniref:spinster family MFS transporter n=1 Tax=Kribbella sp. NPDC056861 TaxID=3154857 RepID=UPI003430D7A7
MTAQQVPLSTAGRVEPGVPPGAWRLVAVLAAANLLNFYDRALPSIVAENIKAEFALSDTQLGLLMSGFTVVYAVSGVVLGRMADRRSRRLIMAVGLVVWSLLTAASGGAWSFASLLVFRLGVGVGEASYAPAANATVFDLFPVAQRSRAIAMLQIGLPLGLLIAFFTTGPMVEHFGTWRAPFFLAAVPGLVIAVLLVVMPVPERVRVPEQQDKAAIPPVRHLLRIPTLWWLVLSGVGLQITSYSIATFLVPLQIRYFGRSLSEAGVGAGIVLGLAGLAGLLIAGPMADRARRVSSARRLQLGAVCMALAVPLVWAAFQLPPTQGAAFVALLAVASLLVSAVTPVALPALSEVVDARLRATSVALYFAAMYVLGGAFGPLATGALSEYFAGKATPTAEISASAAGLHTSMMWLLPISFVVAALGVLGATTTIERDRLKVEQKESAR